MAKVYIEDANIWYKTRKRMKECIEEIGDYWTSYSEYANVVLNFGSDYYMDITNRRVLNRRTDYMIDKIKMNQRMDRRHIPHPPTFYYPFNNLPDIDRLCIIKRRKTQMGKNIEIKKFSELTRKDKYYDKFIQLFIPFERQYRVVVHTKGTFGVKEKIPKSDYDDVKIYNQEHCKFRLRYNLIDSKLGEFCYKVNEEMGIDFAGYDIGEIDGKYFVIEINSAPALHYSFARPFAEYLVNMAKEVEKYE